MIAFAYLNFLYILAMALESTHIVDITHAIQLAVAPVFLMTAIMTLINVLNARLGRTIDRRRLVEKMRHELPPDDLLHSQRLFNECQLHKHRLKLIYWSILSAVIAALLICLVVVGAFVGALISVEVSRGIAVLFILSIVALVFSLILFLREAYLMIEAHDIYG